MQHQTPLVGVTNAILTLGGWFCALSAETSGALTPITMTTNAREATNRDRKAARMSETTSTKRPQMKTEVWYQVEFYSKPQQRWVICADDGAFRLKLPEAREFKARRADEGDNPKLRIRRVTAEVVE